MRQRSRPPFRGLPVLPDLRVVEVLNCPVCDSPPVASKVVKLDHPSGQSSDGVICRRCRTVYAPDGPSGEVYDDHDASEWEDYDAGESDTDATIRSRAEIGNDD